MLMPFWWISVAAVYDGQSVDLRLQLDMDSNMEYEIYMFAVHLADEVEAETSSNVTAGKFSDSARPRASSSPLPSPLRTYPTRSAPYPERGSWYGFKPTLVASIRVLIVSTGSGGVVSSAEYPT